MFETLMSGISGAAGQATAWLLTYALHSTLFLALAWLASRRLSRWARLEEAVWRFALLAGLVTATVQLAAGWEPLAGRWTLESPTHTVAAQALPSAPLSIIELSAATPVHPVPAAAPAWSVDLRTAALGLWAFGALLLALRWSWSYLRLHRRLRARPEVIGGGMHSLFGRLSGEAGLASPVRLTCSSRVSVPVALGMLRPEICVPPRALSHLAPEQQEGMLAHELAHLVRRDPFWLAFSRLLSGILFFQPLNRVASRRLRELSERLCDEWAVERTGRPLSLARCLTEVAGWSIAPLKELPVPSMADRPSSLAWRIRHLLDDARSPERRVRPLWLGAAMLVVLITVAAAAPGVAAASKEPELAEPELAADPLDKPGDLGDLGESDLDQARLEEMSKRLSREAAELSDKYSYSKDYEALAERISNQMEPELERISEQVNLEMMPEIERLSKEVADRVAKLGPEIERLQAEAERLRKDGKLSDEDRDRIRDQARELARRARPSDEEMRAIREAQRKYRDEVRKAMDEHRGEIDAARREIRLQADAMREEVRRQLEADPKLREIREQHRQEMEKLRERHREEMRQDREKAKEKEEKDKG